YELSKINSFRRVPRGRKEPRAWLHRDVCSALQRRSPPDGFAARLATTQRPNPSVRADDQRLPQRRQSLRWMRLGVGQTLAFKTSARFPELFACRPATLAQ